MSEQDSISATPETPVVSPRRSPKRTIKRPPVLRGDIAEIHLTQNQVAIVDATDLPLVAGYNWHAKSTKNVWYAVTTTEVRRNVPMQRLIAGHQLVDHRDGNGLNNRRSNLRPCTTMQNVRNRRPLKGTSAYKGVCWSAANKRWRAAITVANKQKHLGLFLLEEDAAKAYDAAARKSFGEFSRLNFPEPAQVTE